MLSVECLRAALWRLFFLITVTHLLSLAVGSSSQAETLSFDQILNQAVAHSWDLRIREKEMGIRQYSLQEVRSLYYPTLSVRFDNQYVHDLTDGDNVISVGDQVVRVDGSSYQHSFTAGMNFLLYDFGARGLRLDNAKKDVRIAALNRNHTLLETKINVLDAFAQCLKIVRRHKTVEATLHHRQKIYTLTCRLQKSGSVGQVEVNDAALALAEAVTEQEKLKRNFEEALLNLAFFTGTAYDPQATTFAPLPVAPDPRHRPRPGRLAEIRAYDEEIRKLKAEREILKKSMFPTISLAANFRMLGSDPDSFSTSLENLEGRDTSAALVARWEVFSGFRDVARTNRLQKEVERLSLEKERRLHDRKREMNSAYQRLLLAQAAVPDLKKRDRLLERRAATDNRLAENRITDRVSFLQREIDLMEQKLAVTLEQMEGRIAGLRLKFWQEGELP
ncbi:MAG: TolC family protein [Deltaproteobacteria bacterium]|nr:TolC family protein [Deltaproteobacteria bacterium]